MKKATPYSWTREGRAAYYAANRERINAKAKERRDAEPPERRAERAERMRQRRIANIEAERERDRRRTRGTLYYRAKVRCVRCGYDRYQGALQWHHVDPETKVDQPSALKRKPEPVVAAELLKCVLLCANCHWEVEAGLWVVSDEHRERSDSFVRGAREQPGAR